MHVFGTLASFRRLILRTNKTVTTQLIRRRYSCCRYVTVAVTSRRCCYSCCKVFGLCRRQSAFETVGRRGARRQAPSRISPGVVVDTQPETQAYAATGSTAVKNFRRESRDLVVGRRAFCHRRRRRCDEFVDTIFSVDAYRTTLHQIIISRSLLRMQLL